jgi:glycosyltransferase involved in cell wall biosynthesis
MVQCLETIPHSQADAVAQYNATAGAEIARRKNPGDLVLCFYGCENQLATSMNPDLKIVEPSIGYSTAAVFAPYRVFVSYAQQHFYYGQRNMLMNPSWTDAVIYNAFSPEEFDYAEQKDDYLLYFGRIIPSKGVDLAIKAAELAGKRLVIAGPGQLKDVGYASTPKHVELVGIADVTRRKQLMSKAAAILGPTYYVEPFGNMVVEGYFSGTPAITTDWGGFTETVVHGHTGFRCRDLGDFVTAIESIGQIDPKVCLQWAVDHCKEDHIHGQYDKYFRKITKFTI